MVDDSLEGTRQHRWMRGHRNVKPEIQWSQLRRRFTPGYEDLLDQGMNSGWYEPSDPIDRCVYLLTFSIDSNYSTNKFLQPCISLAVYSLLARETRPVERFSKLCFETGGQK
jgi:hypothetical protein